MRRLCQLEAIITHAVSQLTHKWIPCPRPSLDETDRVDPHAFSLRDWSQYIASEIEKDSDSPWVLRLSEKNLSPVGLATVIFDHLAALKAGHAHFIDYFHPSYPHLLKHIADAPSGFTVQGDLSLLEGSKTAIVGSRKASDFAYQETRRVAQKLASSGRIVVSGGAVGCDAAAHLGVLESHVSPAPTIIVLAGGLKRYYPECLRQLFAELRDRGALFLSEKLWDYPARPYDFPVRNRIIAGLSSELLLMQAAEKSGAIGTASFALREGRDVYVLVHESDDVRANGSRQLLDEGAYPLSSALDFLSL